MGVVGISIHNLKDRNGYQSQSGSNPFNGIYTNGVWLSGILKSYNPPHWDSKDVYNYISNNISAWVEEAIHIRNRYL